MADVPEHLLKRSQERRKALGLPVEGEEAVEPTADAPEAAAEVGAEEAAPGGEPRPAAAAGDGDAITEDKGGIPAHLLERSRKRKAALAGGGGGEAAAAGGGGRHAAAAATAVAAPAPTSSGPGGHTQRLLTVVKSRFDPAGPRRGAGQGARLAAPARDRVRVDPVAHGVHHDLLGVGEGAAARSGRRERRRRTRRRRRGTSSVCKSC